MEEKNKHWWLYVLKLEQDNYYVGITTQSPEKRFWEHKNGIRGASWTGKYRPVEIVFKEDLGYISKVQAETIENRKTREYMKEFGLNNVRGGDLTDTDGMVIRLNRIYTKRQWEIVVASAEALFAILLAIVFYLLYVFKK